MTDKTRLRDCIPGNLVKFPWDSLPDGVYRVVAFESRPSGFRVAECHRKEGSGVCALAIDTPVEVVEQPKSDNWMPLGDAVDEYPSGVYEFHKLPGRWIVDDRRIAPDYLVPLICVTDADIPEYRVEPEEREVRVVDEGGGDD